MYQVDTNGDIVISGFEKGVADDPYTGISDARSVNLSTIPGEASVSFKGSAVFLAPDTGSQTGLSSATYGVVALPRTLHVESHQWIILTNAGTSGLSTNTPYYLNYSDTGSAYPNDWTYTVSSTFKGTTATITGDSSITFYTVVPSSINYIQKSSTYNFALDSNGRVWSDQTVTDGNGIASDSTSSWVYIGNSTDATSNGNGLLVFTTVHDGTGGSSTPPTIDEWLFVWRNSQIDYTQLTSGGTATAISWVNGWNYKLTTGTTTGHTLYLNTRGTVANPHHALVTPDSRVNFCDGNYIGNWYQNVPSAGDNYVGFDPATAGTWTPQTITALMPSTEVSQCLGFVNQYLLVGGRGNTIYPWDLNPANNTYNTPLILLTEKNVSAIITVGNNGYVFAGNRGNIYITNGSQASFYKKVPDHISGSVEPLFTWGNGTMTGQCAAYQKNRLYFGCGISLQNSATATGYGGLWCLDLATKALYQAQEMSHGSYSGYVSAVGMSALQSNVAGGISYGPNIGYGLLAGWSDGAGSPSYGIDASIATPYSGEESYITSDLIPIGTAIEPVTSQQVEFKLSTPLVSGEYVELKIGSYFDPSYSSFTSLGSTGYSSGSTTISDIYSINVEPQQWTIVQALLVSTNTTPSYTRLKELRIKRRQS